MASKGMDKAVIARLFDGVLICRKCNAINRSGRQNIDGLKCRKCNASALRKRKKRKV